MRQLLRWAPRKRKLKGSMLHRIVGDRLFDPAIWKLSAKSVAAGLAVGTFVAFTPTFSIQMILVTVLAYWLRVNIPAALLAVWITNPLTLGVIYGLEYYLGAWICSFFSLPDVADFQPTMGEAKEILEMMDIQEKPNLFKNTFKHAKYLIIGSLLPATIFSLLVYGIFYPLFKRIELRRIRKHKNRY